MRLNSVVTGDFVGRGHPDLYLHDARDIDAVVFPERETRRLNATCRQPTEDLADLRLQLIAQPGHRQGVGDGRVRLLGAGNQLGSNGHRYLPPGRATYSPMA